MEENKKHTILTQKDYQKKYDKKTKMVSIKYVLSEMDDYDRLMQYLNKTGKTKNAFIKELINDFFEHKKYEMNEGRIADYFKDFNINEELLDKLKTKVGESKFNIIMDYYRDTIKDELYEAYMDKGAAFDEWIELFIDDIECGEININIPDQDFRRMIDVNISQNMGYVFYS